MPKSLSRVGGSQNSPFVVAKNNELRFLQQLANLVWLNHRGGLLNTGHSFSVPFTQPLPCLRGKLDSLNRYSSGLQLLELRIEEFLEPSLWVPFGGISLGRFSRTIAREADPDQERMHEERGAFSAATVFRNTFHFPKEHPSQKGASCREECHDEHHRPC